MPAPGSASATCQAPFTAPLRPADNILEPVMRCAQCGEAINARDIVFEDGPAVTNSS